MVDRDNQCILEGLTRTSKMGSPSASTATNMGIWQRNAEQRRRNKKLGHVSNVTKKDILPEIANESKQ